MPGYTIRMKRGTQPSFILPDPFILATRGDAQRLMWAMRRIDLDHGDTSWHYRVIPVRTSQRARAHVRRLR